MKYLTVIYGSNHHTVKTNFELSVTLINNFQNSNGCVPPPPPPKKKKKKKKKKGFLVFIVIFTYVGSYAS